MPSAREFIAFAEECEQLAKRLPEHATALLEIAAAWRRLAEKADVGDMKNGDIKSGDIKRGDETDE